ncbi:MAG: glucoamylase family protein [Bacteroidia bacterium]
MRNFFQQPGSKRNYVHEEPLRAELFSAYQMERFGKSLATKHELSTKPAKDHLIKRLIDNEDILHAVHKLLTDAIKRKYQITPASEWLMDNFYLVEEHIRSAKIHFPKDYSEDLPQLATGASAGLTRIYDIALKIISHSDGRIDLNNLSGFINAYQSVHTLKMGELWAIPIMLRLALIENLRRVSVRIAIDRVDSNLADYWVRQMVDTGDKNPKDLILVIADMARSNPPMVSAFVSELTRQLRGKGPNLGLSLNWIEQQLSETGLTSTDMISAEIQKQAADQVSMSNSIGSLRFLGALDWRDFVETHSIVNQLLSTDETYAGMDFSTRDRYRHVVEHIAKKSTKTEVEVANIALALSNKTTLNDESDNRESHVGYFLIGDGTEQTKKLANMRVTLMQHIRKIRRKNYFSIYLSSIAFITAIITIGILALAFQDTNNKWLLLLIGILSVLCASQLSISVVNFYSTIWVHPHLLPRMDFSKKIPVEFSTLVIVPSMLSSHEEIETLVDALEVRFLANRNNNLHFGLVTDFVDATIETLPEDQSLVEYAQQKIIGLNRKYGRNNNDLFFLFHRSRQWNAKENAWMGYERKRGKLAELNALLQGEKNNFSIIVGNNSVFPKIKYVITLDADTQLPLGSAWKLIGTMAHPLNRPWYDLQKKRVTKGYGILQPRVTVSLPETNSSVYTRMHGNEPGIDPYTRASSDVYQDLFQEGSFIGKGIYDIAIFKKALDGRFLENSILSHDLLEGCYVRSGLLSDVQLFEKYPTTYRADMKRRSRWVRGDWQIFSWFLPFVPGSDNKWHKNPISRLSRWKIFDNIRRSLVPIALTVLIVMGWLVLSSSTMWTIVVSAIIVIPVVFVSIWDTINKPKDVTFLHHIQNSIRNIKDIFIKTSFTLICLPYEAYANFVAIARTVGRMSITKKKLLEWDPSANVERYDQASFTGSYISMWIEPFLAIVVFFYLRLNYQLEITIAGPIVLFWFISPAITWKISKPLAKQDSTLSTEQHVFLRKLSRKTWSFFERFVVEQDNWLPPDNFQEQPTEQLAHRTSPTNIGLSLLSTFSAHDFGYITLSETIERTSHTLSSMKKMERYKGHFYNWYDTETLAPLHPKYISTVDSGNLVGHLLVTRQGLLALPYQRVQTITLLQGLLDTLEVLNDSLPDKEKTFFEECIVALKIIAVKDKITLTEVTIQLASLEKKNNILLEKLSTDTTSDASWWMDRFQHQLKKINQHFQIFEYRVLLEKAPSKFVEFNLTNLELNLMDSLALAENLSKNAIIYQSELNTTEEVEWLLLFQQSLTNFIQYASELITTVDNLAQTCHELSDIEWNFLYNNATNLLSIGYNVQDHRMDESYYDLLASEARLAIFIGIAQGKLPEESWFALGRLLTNVNGESILLSWSGSMFEYLMPLLVMPTFENTLLDQTFKSAVNWQIEYGRQAGFPWGISESGYNMINANSNYQYRAFGAPGLGLKRGLDEDAVIAPYATALALMVKPEKACENLELLQQSGFCGRHGMYEAIDYTPSRLQRGQTHAIIYSFMAHHQGMSLLSLAYLLLDKPMQKLFEAEPQFKAAILLLQERVPRASTFFAHTTDIADVNYVASETETRVIHTPTKAIPEVQLLSNGKYHVMITNSGAGYSKWKGLAVTRWREDVTRDNWGTFCYIRDVENDVYWSNTHQPTRKNTDTYEVTYSQGRVDFRSTINEIETHTEIVVSPEDDIEMRRSHITNYSNKRRTIEVTSYAEVVLTDQNSDIAQPAFNNLFVQTEIVAAKNAILCTRRPRANEQTPWMFHLMTLQDKEAKEISYETDRMAFIGRDNSSENPIAMSRSGPLSGSQGSVLDPIVAIRYKFILEPYETIVLDMIMGVTDTKETCTQLVSKYQDKSLKDRVFGLAWTHSQVVLRQINASEADAQLYGHLASSILFLNSAFRAEPLVLINNRRGQSGLWGYSISGDLPIVLLKVEHQVNINIVRQLIQAHSYWRLKGIAVDLVIWNEDHGGYRQVFQNEIHDLIPSELVDKPGGIFVRASDQISNEDRILFETVARINISDNGGTLADHAKRKPLGKATIPYLKTTETYQPSVNSLSIPTDLLFFNGHGGFKPDGNEYIIAIDEHTKTPAPWINVLANPNFGTIVSESGSAYTWAENAHEFRLTPWSNDPVCDPNAEAFYIRDEETGHFWSTTLLPARGTSTYITRHGFGYSVFEHLEDDIKTEMTVFVDLNAKIKFTIIKIRNQSGKNRKLSATGYVEWVLGGDRSKTAMYMHTEVDPKTGALFANNPYSTEFPTRVAFFDVDYLNKTFTADRTEFIGRNGNLQSPEALKRTKLSGKIGMALDPCAAIQLQFELADGEEQEFIFRLGASNDADEASELVKKFRGVGQAYESLEKIKRYWNKTINALHVETPDISINLITNGWLTYQTLSSRLWGRSGFYQSGGAFGFRDQLQDVLSLLHAAPKLAREQILLCSSRQFKEGDVQHWWHPPAGRGVRTKCSDDFLWLPFVTSIYIRHTGDVAILEESRPYLEGRQLNEREESYYDLPLQSAKTATLYEHCVQAIKHGFDYGIHGLPLIGMGDWNDGYDKVGEKGKGESVWLGFFFYDILIRFETIATSQSDIAFVDECKKQAQALKENIHKSAWDGEWYKRAWFDNGDELGSSKNEECKIDSIAQSWSVISGAGDEKRMVIAMESAYKNLVQKKSKIIQLLEPPFDKSNLNPGYIKGYVPGVRENGGQYTHAAVWLIIAFARLGENKKVWELLNMINPVNHGRTAEEIAIYKVEPYVLAADVYARTPHEGRGGWTWYTGSASWMYQLITESFLGIQQHGDKLHIVPCIPTDWDSFKVDYRYKNTMYKIKVIQQETVLFYMTVDGNNQPDNQVKLVDDGVVHHVLVTISKAKEE